LSSQQGLHQGCPLGLVAFASAIHDTLQSTQGVPLTWQTWYLDDGILVGDLTSITQAALHLGNRFANLGLLLNTAKCTLWGPIASEVLLEGVPVVPWSLEHGITVLGCPVNHPGSSYHTKAAWQQATEKVGKICGKLSALGNPQIAHYLMQNCVDACRVTHLLRASDAYAAGVAIQACEDILLSTFEDICGLALTTQQFEQVCRQLSTGGCGVNPQSPFAQVRVRLPSAGSFPAAHKLLARRVLR